MNWVPHSAPVVYHRVGHGVQPLTGLLLVALAGACVPTDIPSGRSVGQVVCAVGDIGDIACPSVWEPVCGDDGRTYSNGCEACRAVESYRDGACNTDDGTIDTPDECAQAGGVWARWGLQQRYWCNLRTADAGAPCTDSNECEGWCITGEIDGPLEECPNVGACSELTGVFGCFCSPPWHGVICVD